MALARVVYTQSVNGNKNFTVPFPYLSRDHVKVTVNGAPASFTWINTNTVQINPAPAVGAVVEIRRVTERRNLLVDFKDGSTITETDLDLLALQNFYLSQEADDLAEESNGIANAAASTANAAITTANAASSAAASAVATANSAKDTANTALANANNAVSTANNALSIANTASRNASAAVATANAAQTAANSAISTANSAKDTANSAVSQATTAVSTANTAAQNAATALSNANTALANSETAISTANTALNKAAAAEGAATTASNAAQSAANSANAAATKAQQLETQFNNLLASVEQIAGADLSDFAKNSDNLAYLTDKAAARANLGLGNVDNTSDLDKPVSLATQAALATKADVRHTHTKADITDLSLSWNAVTGKPSRFPPSAHTHTKSEITDLASANVATATKLQTARTLTIGNTGKVFDGSADVSWSLDEIGAARFGFLSQTNLNNAINPGFYRLEGGLTNAPPDVQYGQLIVARGGGDTILQIVTGYNNGEIYWRQGNPPEVGGPGFWGPWRKIYHSGNLGDATVSTAGIVRLATLDEAWAGVDNSRAVTPAGAMGLINRFGLGGGAVPLPASNLDNNTLPTGFYFVTLQNTSGHMIVSREANGKSASQIYLDNNSGSIFTRVWMNSRWSNWVEIIHSGKLNAAFNAPGAAPLFACRAWVIFNGVGAGTIRGSGNVSSITYHGTGDYTINFMVAMPDANYAAIGTCNWISSGSTAVDQNVKADDHTPTSVRIRTIGKVNYNYPADNSAISVAIFR